MAGFFFFTYPHNAALRESRTGVSGAVRAMQPQLKSAHFTSHRVLSFLIKQSATCSHIPLPLYTIPTFSKRHFTKIDTSATCKPCCFFFFFLSPSSVEHDFRQQEGRLQCVMEALEGEYDVPAPTLNKPPAAPPSSYRPSTKGRVKKLRKKCFWWL